MPLNSNSDNSNISLIQTFFFFALWPKNALANSDSDFCTFTVTNGKKKWRQILNFYVNCGKISFSVLKKFASPEKLSMEGICRASPSPKFTLLPVTSMRHQFSLLARRKYEVVLAKCADLPLERCPTTSPHLSTATVCLPYSFSDFGRTLRISPFLIHSAFITCVVTSVRILKCSSFWMLNRMVELSNALMIWNWCVIFCLFFLHAVVLFVLKMLVAGKRKYTRKALREKYQALKDLEKGEGSKNLAAKHNVPKNTLLTWVKNKEKLLMH